MQSLENNIYKIVSKQKTPPYFACGSLEYLIMAGISFLGFKFLVIIHDSTVSYASSMMSSGANLY